VLEVEREIDGAYVFRVLCVDKNLLPALTAVERTVHARSELAL
jgi:hypothetical protein